MLPLQPQSTDPEPSDSPGGDEICRKYIWGTCNKYEQCKYRHELDVEKMKDILRFCHDYQNKNGCVRQNCKYLHATKEEQNTFLSTGQLPRVLAERHAALATTASNMQTNAPAETIPQIAMFINESYMTQPPPATWPPLPHQAVLPPVTTAAPPPPPPPPTSPRHVPTLQPIQQAQQPTTLQGSSIGQLRPALTAYSAAPPPVLYAMNQPPAIFDASRPPPPIPSQIQTGQLKRKTQSNGNVGPSKIRKPEGSELSDDHCENCVQREKRIEGYKHQMETLHCEEESENLAYTKKLQEYEIGRDLLKKIVGPELFTVFDNLIEGAQTPQIDNAGSSFLSGSSTVSKQDLLQLFQMWFGGSPRNIAEPAPSTSHVDGTLQTLQSLTSLSRRINVTNYTNPEPDLIKFVMETLRNNSSTLEKSPSVVERPMEPTGINRMNNRSNGFMANGQNAPTGMGEPARFGFPAAGAASQEYGARALPNYSAAGPSGFAAAAPVSAPPPAAFPMFHPAVPPPNSRQYYGQSPAGPGISNMPYNGVERVPGPNSFQGMMPPSVMRPSQGNAPNYHYTARYPQPPFFPPYQ